MSKIYVRKNPRKYTYQKVLVKKKSGPTHPKIEPNPVPFSFQITGIRFLVKRKCALLADDMGLGKTFQAIRAQDIIISREKIQYTNRTLVLCPAIARYNWKAEFQRFSATLKDYILVFDRSSDTIHQLKHMNDPYKGAISCHRWPHGKVVICSYDLVDVVNEVLAKQQWDFLILDESHFLKNPASKRTKAVFGPQGVVHRSTRIWALSGTPAPNNPAELWPMLYVFGVTTLGFKDFVRKYCNWYLGPRGELRITGANQGEIPGVKFMLQKIMMRRKKQDVMASLPPIYFTDIVVPPGKVDLDITASFVQYVWPHPREHELHAQLEKERMMLENSVKVLGLRLNGLKMLQSIASSLSSLRRYTGLQKVETCAELVKLELIAEKYNKIVIFAIHRDVIENLRVALQKFNPLTLYGGTPPDKRRRNIEKFQTYPRFRVFIANIQAAGTAISLTAADQVLFVEQDWVPGNNAQAAARCHRMGQKNTVFVRFAGLANSIDQKISQALKAKTRDLTSIFDKIEACEVDDGINSEFSKIKKENEGPFPFNQNDDIYS